MKKLLYITDQEEYSQRGTIGPLFNDYLKEHLEINLVYVTKYKHSFQKKGDDFIFPQSKEKDLISYLERKNLHLASYDYIFVRNKANILEQVLKYRNMFNYKVGFRVSYPKTLHIAQLIKAKKKLNFFNSIKNMYDVYHKRKLSNQCDIFMPSSFELQKEFYPDITTKIFPIYSGLDPKRITSHEIVNDDTKRFVYVGTIDELRQFDVVLDAFEEVKDQNWEFIISCKHAEYINKLLEFYPNIQDKVKVISAKSLDHLRDIINNCDVSLAAMPDINIYNTTFPAKTLDGYSSAIPAILSDNPKNKTVFSEDEAFFTNFDKDSIVKQLKTVLDTSKEDLKAMGRCGQDKLLKLDRNYEIMAKSLFEQLEKL